jgi:hypothetical protein
MHWYIRWREWGQSLISDYGFIFYIISGGYIDSANYILIILITNQGLNPIQRLRQENKTTYFTDILVVSAGIKSRLTRRFHADGKKPPLVKRSIRQDEINIITSFA